jgi:hypothetical protein
MLMAHPEILASTTVAEILDVLSKYSPSNHMMHVRSSFVDHFRYFPTSEPNGLGGHIWRHSTGHEFNFARVYAFIDSHEISKFEFLKLLDDEADLVDGYFRL